MEVKLLPGKNSFPFRLGQKCHNGFAMSPQRHMKPLSDSQPEPYISISLPLVQDKYMATADKAKHRCPIRLPRETLEKGRYDIRIVQAIEKITGQEEEAWTQGIGLRSQILLGESVSHEGMEDRIAFAFVDTNSAAFICQAHFEIGAFPQAKQNSGRLIYRRNDGFINRLPLMIVLLLAHLYVHEKGPFRFAF